MVESPVNLNDSSTSSNDTPSCEECGGSGYVDHSGSLSYGDPGYGDPDGNKEPCPKCNSSHSYANYANDGNSAISDEAGCFLIIVGIIIFIGVIISVVMWLTR